MIAVEKKKPGLIFEIASLLMCLLSSYVAKLGSYDLFLVWHYGKCFAFVLAVSGIIYACNAQMKEGVKPVLSYILGVAAIVICMISFTGEISVIQVVSELYNQIAQGAPYIRSIHSATSNRA